jgi:hypothetical protein
MRKRCLYLLVVVLCFSQCKKNKWSHLPDTTISSFAYTYPARDTAIMLDTLANTVISFSWAPATTGNYTLVFYRLLIDKVGGDFSKPLYSGTPGGVGTALNVALTPMVLNNIAGMAGINTAASGKLQWKVVGSNGVVSDSAMTEIRGFTVQRP